MGNELNKFRRNTVRFNAEEIALASKVIQIVKHPLEVVYYLLPKEQTNTLLLILISAEDTNLHTLLQEEKRDSDLLFEIDKEKKLYAMICQDTQVLGGYKFGERLMRKVFLDGGKSIYFSEVEVNPEGYPLKQVLLNLVDIYIVSKQKKRKDEIIFLSLR